MRQDKSRSHPSRQAVMPIISQALREDKSLHDVTSRSLLSRHAQVKALLVANAAGIVCGAHVAKWVFGAVDSSLRCRLLRPDGTYVRRGDVLLRVSGQARSILTAERTALNFLGHLSGVATLTAQMVHRAKSRGVSILDTRKTIPGLRRLERYAVRTGGGHNHRDDLQEAILIKTNHLRAVSNLQNAQGRAKKEKAANKLLIAQAIAKAKKVSRVKYVGIEVTCMREFKIALCAEPDIILLDNWSISGIRRAVALRKAACRAACRVPLLEASGGITLARVQAIGRTGVERISIGRLTHSAPTLDCSLRVL